MRNLEHASVHAKPSNARAARKLNPAARWFLEMDQNGRGKGQHEFWNCVSDHDKMRYASELMRWKQITIVHEFARFAPSHIKDFVLSSNVRRKKLGLPAIDVSKRPNYVEDRMG